ncbi:colicin D domain-containing protein [Nocardioides houyundeii]|uniref:colicin D domain-containing protein n=1 Tax=Nocardioides houyundeii TaxID=2045452 RepID=UPI000DF29C4C|nr:colicin D domain-containing protein [Nocardioides houyundeii]
MRLAVDVVGFTDAAEACCSGNQITAMLTQSLSGNLSGYAGMAGDDAMGADFAAEYDAAARESLGALVELIYAFSSLSRLLATSGDNHGRAEAAAAGRVYNADTSWPASHFVHYRPPPPPASLGANNPDLGLVQTWVLDHVEGFIWPGADVHQLLAAAAAWQSTASSIADLEHQCDEAITLLERQHSPEVPLATTALADLRSLIGQTAQEMHAIASSCEEYAEAVRTTHERTLALINEICQMIVEGIAFSAVVGLLSSGIGAGAAGTAAMARIATQTPRFHALLVTLRVTTTKAVTRLRQASNRLDEVRRRAGKYPRVRDERGSIRLPGPPGRYGKPEFPEKSLRRKFKHAGAFGVSGPYNPANAGRFERALREFIDSAGVIAKSGTMRGQAEPVVFHYDEVTRKCVVTDECGRFISGWVLSTDQLAAVIRKGHLGAG